MMSSTGNAERSFFFDISFERHYVAVRRWLFGRFGSTPRPARLPGQP